MHETIFGRQRDIFFMQEALKEAQCAERSNEVPIGAIVVDEQGMIIGRGANEIEQSKTQRAHAEIIAIERAATHIADWRLNDCWLYVTLEPCLMCMGLILLSRISGVVFGAPSPLFGYRLDTLLTSSVYKNDTLTIVEGVCAAEAAELLKAFFKTQRQQSERNFP